LNVTTWNIICGFDDKDDPVNWKLALCTHIQHCSHNSC